MQKRVITARFIKFMAALAVIVLIVVLAVVLRERMFSSGVISQAISFTVPAEADIYAFGTGYLVRHQGKLQLYNAQGVIVQSIDLFDENAILSVGKTRFALCQNQELYIYGADGKLLPEAPGAKALGLEPSQILCGETFVAITDETGQNVHVVLYSNFNGRLSPITHNDSTVLATGAFTQNKVEYLWVISMASSGAEPETTVTIYQLSEASVTKQGGYAATDEIIYRFIVDSAGKAGYAVGTQYITCYNNEDGARKEQLLAYGYQYFTHGLTGQAAIVLAPAEQLPGGRVTSLRIIRNGAAQNIALSAPVSALVLGQKSLYAANESTIYTMDYTGKVISRHDVSAKYISVQALSNQTFLFRTDTEAHVMKLP